MISFVRKRELLSRTIRAVTKSQSRNGYIVLVPEIGEEPSGKNHLFGENNLPEFNNFTIEACIAKIGHQALDFEKQVKQIEEKVTKEGFKDVFEEVIDPIEKSYSELEATWGVAKTLYLGNSSLMPTKSYMSIHERARKASVIKFNSQPIFEAVKATETSDPEKKRVLGKYVLEGKLNGIHLEQKQKDFLNATLTKLHEKKQKFRANVDKSIELFQYFVHDANVVKEFPPHLLQALAADPKQPTNSPWKISLTPFVVQSFLEYCPNHDMRWNVWQADTRKASGFSDKALANSATLEEVRGCRLDQAKLLGFKTFADMSMETKMVGSVEKLEELLGNLLQAARPVQDQEISGLVDFAESNGFKHQFEVFDVPYWKRRQLLETSGFDEEALRDYFPCSKVVEGMFGLAEKLFGIRIVENSSVSRWDEDVKFYEVFDAGSGTLPLGGFYVDLYSRDGVTASKALIQGNSGWNVALKSRSTLAQTIPLAALMFSLPPPIYGKPTLLSLVDMQLLFFRFGQALQNLLTKASYSEVAGLSGMPWDVVQVSGNVLSQFLYDPATLKSISSHYKTEDVIPDSKISAIQASRSHLSAFSLCQQLYLSTLDLQMHSTQVFWYDLVKDLYPKHFVFPLDKKDAHPCSFKDVICGEWPAAYFSHLYAKLIAADVYSAFEEGKKASTETGLAEVGRRFRDTFLAYGGSEQTFRQFRGRDPSPKALLQNIQQPKIKQ